MNWMIYIAARFLNSFFHSLRQFFVHSKFATTKKNGLLAPTRNIFLVCVCVSCDLFYLVIWLFFFLFIRISIPSGTLRESWVRFINVFSTWLRSECAVVVGSFLDLELMLLNDWWSIELKYLKFVVNRMVFRRENEHSVSWQIYVSHFRLIYEWIEHVLNEILTDRIKKSHLIRFY